MCVAPAAAADIARLLRVQAVVHPDTGDPIFAPFRFAAFTPANLPICAMLLVSPRAACALQQLQCCHFPPAAVIWLVVPSQMRARTTCTLWRISKPALIRGPVPLPANPSARIRPFLGLYLRSGSTSPTTLALTMPTGALRRT